MPSLQTLKNAFGELRRDYGYENYWYLRRLKILAQKLNVNNFAEWQNCLEGSTPYGMTGFRDLISFLLVMRAVRMDCFGINEEEREKYGSWNEYFQEKILSTFPNVANYNRMYGEAMQQWGIETLFPRHGTNHSPIADILNYSGYIYLKLLADNVNLETLSQYCHATVDELKAIQEKIEDLRNRPDFSIDDIAEEIQVPVAVAKRMYSKLNPNAEGDKNVPRVVRRNENLVYFLPKEANFSSKDCEEIRYRFKFSGSSVPVWIIYKKKGNCWRHYNTNFEIPLANCFEITVCEKRGAVTESQKKELDFFYVFEGDSEKPARKLRSGTSYSFFTSGCCPENAKIIIRDADGNESDLKYSLSLPANSVIMLKNGDDILQSMDVNSGNEIEFFVYQTPPVGFVAKNDIPCFSAFPEIELDVDNAEILINGQKEDEVDTCELYGEVLTEVKYNNSTRRRRCRILPNDFKITISVDGNEKPFSCNNIQPIDFNREVKFVFSSGHLKGEKIEFLLPAMKRRVELKLELDNGQFIPIKFEIPRTAGAFISLKAKNVSRIPFVKVKWDHPVEEPQQVDWEEFKEFGTLHISRNPNQEFAVMLKGHNILRGAKFRTLELSYEDLCEMVNYKESELFSVTEISVFFLGNNQREEHIIKCKASSLKSVTVSPRGDDLELILPCARKLWSKNLFLVLKKVEDQAADSLIVLPEDFNKDKIAFLPDSCVVSKCHCTLQFATRTKDNQYVVKMTVPGFYKQGQQDFSAKGYLGFVLKPGKYSGFIRCNQGFFIPTNWKSENEESYFDDLMCGREFLENWKWDNISTLEQRFKACDDKVRLFIDKFLEFGKFAQAQAFMDVCFHRREFVEKENRWGGECRASGYIFLAENYWLEKLNRGEVPLELLRFWDPELFTIEAIEKCIDENAEINEDYKEKFPTLYAIFCYKSGRKYGNKISKDEVDLEIQKVTMQKYFGVTQSVVRYPLNRYAEWLAEWRKNPSICSPTIPKFYNLREKLQILRNEYPKCYQYVAEQSWGNELNF